MLTGKKDGALSREVLRQIGKLIADCDRFAAQSAVTNEHIDALARAAATTVPGRGTRKTAFQPGRRLPVPWSRVRRSFSLDDGLAPDRPPTRP